MHCLAVFSSRNETLYLAKMLIANGYRAGVVNTPKEAGLACGISVKFEERSLPNVKMFISSKPFRSYVGIYRINIAGNRNSYEKLC